MCDEQTFLIDSLERTKNKSSVFHELYPLELNGRMEVLGDILSQDLSPTTFSGLFGWAGPGEKRHYIQQIIYVQFGGEVASLAVGKIQPM